MKDCEIKSAKGQMVRLIEIYDAIRQLDAGMKPLFGELCGNGLFQNIEDSIVRVIEYNSDKRGLKADSDEWIQLLYETLGNQTSSGERAEKLLNEDEIVL